MLFLNSPISLIFFLVLLFVERGVLKYPVYFFICIFLCQLLYQVLCLLYFVVLLFSLYTLGLL